MTPIAGWPGAGGISADGVGANAASAGGDRAKLSKACVEFESLLLAQMLKDGLAGTMSSLDGESADGSSNSISDFASEQVARALAASGGLGLSALIERDFRAPAALSTAGATSPTQQ